jgi:hypothetical protein
MTESLSSSTDGIIYTLNPTKLLYFFDKNKLTTTLLITILSFRIGEFVLDIYNNVFYPIINAKKNGKSIEDKYIIIFDTRIQIGKVIVSFIRVIIVMYLMYIIALIVKKVSKK